MSRMRALFLAVGLLVAPLVAGAAGAAEVIHDFAQTIRMSGEDRLVVTEELEFQVEGRVIKRGIFRDVPTTFVDAEGRRRQVGFDVLSVERNGRPEPYRVERNRDGTRITIGQEDVFLDPGRHTYTITYETTRQIRRFPDHDELYWNVTGNEWVFPIERASARVILPEGVTAGRTTAFTGAFGEQGRDWRVREEDGGRSLLFSTTAELAPGEGFTIVVELPKGAIAEPTATDELGYTILDYRSEIVGGFGLLAVLGYHLWAWRLVGRDPAGGTIIPLFDAPPGISPALSNYVHHQGFSGGGWTALSAAAISLAVKGLIVFEDLDGTVRLERTDKPAPADLPRGEAAALDWLDDRGGSASIDRRNGSAIVTLGSRFRSAIEKENRGRFFVTNRRYAVVGALLTVVALIAILAFGDVGPEEIVLLAPLLVVSIFAAAAAAAVRAAFKPGASVGSRVGAVVAVGAALFALLVGGTITAFLSAEMDIDFMPPLLVAVFVGANVLFFSLLRAPTALGRRVMDGIEGLRLYLSVAERERMNMAGAPAMTPSRFETLLPYAIALGVEKPWSEAFEAWLTSAAAAGAAVDYQPAWYHGDLHGGRFSDRISDTLGGMSTSFQSALPPPESSSSGFSGGGGSGGGGGGGGGGGW